MVGGKVYLDVFDFYGDKDGGWQVENLIFGRNVDLSLIIKIWLNVMEKLIFWYLNQELLFFEL